MNFFYIIAGFAAQVIFVFVILTAAGKERNICLAAQKPKSITFFTPLPPTPIHP